MFRRMTMQMGKRLIHLLPTELKRIIRHLYDVSVTMWNNFSEIGTFFTRSQQKHISKLAKSKNEHYCSQ
ncbi:hypothetical protein SNEBB_003349 [Seison nebaliae]|nr:hypothetical protein SNEBB_003349 [Seison nebaliae]